MQTLISSPHIIAVLNRSPLHLHRNALNFRPFSSTSSDYNQSRGGLPRFFSETLPPSKGGVVRVEGDEFWHMTKVLRLNIDDRVQLFNGKGSLVEGRIGAVDRTGVEFEALENPKLACPQTTQWHVFAAIGTLKGGRADWLVEKCTVAQSKLSFVAVAEATSVFSTLNSFQKEQAGVMIIGPEGDFTKKELNDIVEAGATAVGLGPHRLRVETATMALLSTLMLWSDSQEVTPS